jgi:hypothetical protein
LAQTNLSQGEPFASGPADGPAVRGFLHRPRDSKGAGLVVTHGAGGNCRSDLLIHLAGRFSETGVTVLRCDLPFRQARPQGPPHPSAAAKDRAGLRNAVAALRQIAPGGVFLGGHSYGGRQATMLAAEDSTVADGLVLLSYPLHPPKTPDKKRTDHFPRLRIASLFIHGTRDPFGSPEEMDAALRLIPAEKRFVPVEGAGHGLVPPKSSGLALDDVVIRTLDEFRQLFGRP